MEGGRQVAPLSGRHDPSIIPAGEDIHPLLIYLLNDGCPDEDGGEGGGPSSQIIQRRDPEFHSEALHRAGT